MAEISKVLQIGDNVRPEILKKNIFKIDSPYDLTDDIITKSLNLLQNITGYDYRNNPVLDIVERLVDAKNSKLVVIGGQRLLVEFGRRAGNNILGKFIPSPTNLIGDLKAIFKGDFKKEDSFITDPKKNPNRGFIDKTLNNLLGYRSNDNYLDSIYGKDNKLFSDINYKFSGDMIKEKILQLNKNSVFSNYNVTSNSRIEFGSQSLIFRNTYSEGFVNQKPIDEKGLYSINILTETYTKTYFKQYAIKKEILTDDYKLAKDYIQETKELEGEQGFGKLSSVGTRESNTDPIQIQRVDSLDYNDNADSNRINQVFYGQAETFRYDSYNQSKINEKFGVKRGLIYFTSKLAEDDNSIINHDVKQLFNKDNDSDSAIYYKGNGACRTFTVYDQYDNFNRVIKFDGNNEKNSVLKESVLPRIAPMIGDREDDKHRYFFTMENLAVKVTANDDCDKGPNGGRWMWFVPYNVKISDNNTVNWSDLNFLGRPEPIFSYQNTTRSLSLSFSLLIDTVKQMQDVKPTIDEYYKYIYACSQEPEPNEESIPKTEPKPDNKPKPKRKLDPISFDTKVSYFFKNDSYGVKYTNIDYTLDDSCLEETELGVPDKLPNPLLSGITFNNNFLGKFTAATQFLIDNIPTSREIIIDINGIASKLFTKKQLKTNDIQYNSDLGYRRAASMMKKLIEYYNANRGSLKEAILNNGSSKLQGYIENITPKKQTLIEEYIINSNEGQTVLVTFKLTSNGQSGASGGSTFDNRNDTDEIKDRQAIITSIKATPKNNTDTDVNPIVQTPEEKEKIARNDLGAKTGLPCDPVLTPKFERLNIEDKFPVGYEKLKTFAPSFNSQTPFDFTKRYVFLHQLTRPARLPKNNSKVDNIVFGRMPVFILRYGDFLHTKAIVRSVNFDISESTWDLNPEGMGAIPLYCNVTMDLTLLGGQSLAGPIDRIQTANDSSFIANTSFNSGRYKDNVRFKSSRGQEFLQYKDKASGRDTTERPPVGDINNKLELPAVPVVKLLDGPKPTPQPFVNPFKNLDAANFIGPTNAEYIENRIKTIEKDKQVMDDQIQKENQAVEENLNENSTIG